MLYIGIDPGKSGGIAHWCSVTGVYDAIAMPDTARQALNALNELKRKYGVLTVFIEKPQAMGKVMGVSTIFSFAQHYGELIGLLTSLDASINEVSPAAWKRKVGVTADKHSSILACERLYPEINLFPGRKTKPHDGIAEAALILQYGRLTYMVGGNDDSKK